MFFVRVTLLLFLLVGTHQQDPSTRDIASPTVSALPVTDGLIKHDNKTDVDTQGDIIITSGPAGTPENNTTQQVNSTTFSVNTTFEAINSTLAEESTTAPVIIVTSCSSNPCQNGGSCKEDPWNAAIYHCTCQDGYAGIRCGVEDLCSTGPNGGICEKGACIYDKDGSSRSCKCFFGKYWDDGKKVCRAYSLPCLPNPCQNGGTCVETDDKMECKCAEGFEGLDCSIRNYCSGDDKCENGVCVSSNNVKHCKCNERFYWNEESKGCSEETPPCEPNPCKNGGHCLIAPSGDSNCTCSGNYEGPLCEVQNLCLLSSEEGEVCKNGVCVSALDTRRCKCNNGYYLDEERHTCKETVRPCSPNPCHNDGQCTPLSSNTFNCTCAEGYVGAECADRDYCVLDGGNAFCRDASCRVQRHLGIFYCECAFGQHFDYSTRKCRDTDFCPLMTCSTNEVCESSECRCRMNYTRDNSTGTCQADFCSSKPCPFDGMECHQDTNEDYQCECAEGHSFNGTHCRSGASCIFPSLNKCSQVCEVSLVDSSASCNCHNEHFHLNNDNETCTYIGNSTCSNVTCEGGVCVNSEEMEKCFCPPGYKDVAGKCVDLCTTGDFPKGLCPDDLCEPVRSGGFRCRCEGKYELASDKTTCTARKMCRKSEVGWHTCSDRNAVCVESWFTPAGFKCECRTGQVQDNRGACVEICSSEADQRSCSDIGARCYVSAEGNRTCRCPPFFHATGNGTLCNRPADSSYLLMLPLNKDTYVKVKGQSTRSSQTDSLFNYRKIHMDVETAMEKLFPSFLHANILACQDKQDYILCKIEIQFYLISDENLKRLQITEICQTNKDSRSFACLIPPSLLLRKDTLRTTVSTTKTDPCEVDVKTELCGSDTTCVSTSDKKHFNCSCSDGFTMRIKMYPFDSTTSFIESCKDIDECSAVNACSEHMICQNTLGSYTCSCSPGYRANGKSAEKCVAICNPNPCVHGHCTPYGEHDFECMCDAGYRGSLCNLQDENFKRARVTTIIVGAVLGGVLLLTLILSIACISRLRKKKYADEPDHMLYATELTERRTVDSGAINNAYQKD